MRGAVLYGRGSSFMGVLSLFMSIHPSQTTLAKIVQPISPTIWHPSNPLTSLTSLGVVILDALVTVPVIFLAVPAALS